MSNKKSIIMMAVILSIFFFASNGMAQTYPPGHPLWGTVVIPDNPPPPASQETTIHIHNYGPQGKSSNSRGYLPSLDLWGRGEKRREADRRRLEKMKENYRRKKAEAKRQWDEINAKLLKAKAARKAKAAEENE